MLSTRELTATLWLRQRLVPGERPDSDTADLIRHLIGLQAQENLSPYLALAARDDRFSAADLSDLLERREAVRFLSLRGTVHVLTATEALGLRGWVQPALDRASASGQIGRPARHLGTAELDTALRPFLSAGPLPVSEIGTRLAETFDPIPAEALRQVARERLPLLQVPPRGLWKRTGGVVYAYADQYLGGAGGPVEEEQLVLRYLAAYGPATAADMTKWSMVTRLGPVFTRMHREERLTTYRDENGRTLYDVPGAPLADAGLALPARLLGIYDNLFLSHADRSRIAPESARAQWMGANGGVGATLFLDGLLAGLWRVENGRVVVSPFGSPTRAQQRGIATEVERVEALLAS